MEEDILAFARTVDDKYTEWKELRNVFNSMPTWVCCTDSWIPIALIPVSAARRTASDCKSYGQWRLSGYECYGIIYKSSSFTCHMALELLLKKDYYIQCPRLTMFSNTDSHHPDTLFSLCLTTNSDQVFPCKSCCRENTIWSEVRFGSKLYEWSDFFILQRYQRFSQADFLCISSLWHVDFRFSFCTVK